MNINITPQNIHQSLTDLMRADKKKYWVKADLSLSPSSFLGRICWCVLKHFSRLREHFYGVNLDKSRDHLHAIKAQLLQKPNEKEIGIYNAAVKLFNQLFPRHKAQEISRDEFLKALIPSPAPAGTPKQMLNSAERISVGTYNILFPQSPVPGPRSTEVGYSVDENGRVYENSQWRLGIVQRNIEEADLDVVCLQEVVHSAFMDLRSALTPKGYGCLWEPHTGGKHAHGVAIFFKKNKFIKLDHRVPAHRFQIPDATDASRTIEKPRKELIVDLIEPTSRKIFRVVSCHLLDPRDFTDKATHVKELLEAAHAPAPRYTVDRTIIAGDMNQDQFGDIGAVRAKVGTARNASAFAPLVQNQYFVDGNYASTVYGKNKIDDSTLVSRERRIDWVWSSYFKPEPLPLPELDKRGSDHLLVASVIC